MTATLSPPSAGAPDPSAAQNLGATATPDPGAPAATPVHGRPFKQQVINTAVIVVLGVLGLVGFSTAYGGTRYLIAGVVGLLLGAGVALVGARRRWGIGIVGLAAIGVFFIFGSSLTLRNPQMLGLLPTPANVSALLDGATQGWAKLVTTYPPVGSRLNLLVIPYLCGLACAVVGGSIAARSRRPMWAVLAPTAVLVLSILFGTDRPASLLLQGAVFVVVVIAWWSYVHRVDRRVDVGTRDTRRTLSAAGILLLAGLFAMAAGEFAFFPGMNDRPRYVIRDHTEPPFDPRTFPSPLNSYRRFTNGARFAAEPEDLKWVARAGWRSTDLFEVEGLPPDTRLRLATLDAYDGTVFDVAAGLGASGHFERVGENLPADPTKPAEYAEDAERSASELENPVTIEVLAGGGAGGAGPYQDIWLPVPEGATSVEIATGDPDRDLTLSENLQFNAATRTAALPDRLAPGDRYSFGGAALHVPTTENVEAWRTLAAPKGAYPERVRPEAVGSEVAKIVEGTFCKEGDVTPPPREAQPGDGTPYRQAELIVESVHKCGAFSDGASGDGQSPAGHGAWRLSSMLVADAEDQLAAKMVGNGEQYGPLVALLAEAKGAPTRVVMGFRSMEESNAWRQGADADGDAPKRNIQQHPADGPYVVTGSDVIAWVEVDLEGAGWVPLWDIIPDRVKPELKPAPQNPKPETAPPPPPPSIPPSEEDETQTNRIETKDEQEEDGFAIPWWVLRYVGIALAPFAVVGAITGLIAWLKSRRRQRRRSAGTHADQIAGGWDEVRDLSTDLGMPVPVRSTRSEEAAFIGTSQAVTLAGHTDALVFGPIPSDSLPVERYWTEVDATRASMTAELSRFQRWKALVNLASFRHSDAARSAASIADSARNTVSGGRGLRLRQGT